MTEFHLRARPLGQDAYLPAEEAGPVSYTHLTLPTNSLV